MAEHLNSDSFHGFLSSREELVLVDFYQDGCIPCRRVAPLLSQAEKEYQGKLVTARVNISQNSSLIEAYQIQAAPTLVLFRDGQEIDRRRGVIDRLGLKQLIETAL